jgi:hypothetical protein
VKEYGQPEQVMITRTRGANRQSRNVR